MFGLPYLDAGTCFCPLHLPHQFFLKLSMCYPLESDVLVGNILIVKKNNFSGANLVAGSKSLWSSQTTEYKIGICCLLRSTSQDRLVQSVDNTSEWSYMSTVDSCFSELALSKKYNHL